jgi:hypothetical protein
MIQHTTPSEIALQYEKSGAQIYLGEALRLRVNRLFPTDNSHAKPQKTAKGGIKMANEKWF